jgi:MFS family permease
MKWFMAVTGVARMEGRPGVMATRTETVMVLAGASVMLSISAGMRQSLGLFMVPMTHGLGITISDFTFAVAMQNLVWGFSQPFVGAFADRFGIRPISIGGVVLYILGLVATIFATGWVSLLLGTGFLMGIALACTAANLGMTASARSVTPAQRSMVLGIISAMGSVGSFICAPLAQSVISSHGWQIALVVFIALSAIMFPAAFATGVADKFQDRSAHAKATAQSFPSVIRGALHHRGYVMMVAAVFVCGLQLFFLTAHLPTYLALCGQDPMLSAKALGTIGMFNIAGCYILGWLGGRYPKHVLLGMVYVLRSITLAVYFMTPVSEGSTLVFAAIMGLLWLGVIPLTQGLVAQMFGLRYLATLSGFAFFNHQIGSFIGVWGGGLIYDALGSYDRAWQTGVVVGLVAGVMQILLGGEPKRDALRPAIA